MAMKKVTVGGQTFEINQPYAEGHVLTAVEARVLNQVRSENIGNNFRKVVKEAGDDPTALQDAANKIAEYDAKYTFAMGGSAREPVDPIDREARRLAMAAVRSAVEEKGHKFKDWKEANGERFEQLVEEVSQREGILKQAKQIVNARSKAGGGDIEL